MDILTYIMNALPLIDHHDLIAVVEPRQVLQPDEINRHSSENREGQNPSHEDCVTGAAMMSFGATHLVIHALRPKKGPLKRVKLIRIV